MSENDQKIVDFDEFCPTCKHWEKKENEDPCWDCLTNPTNTNSHKPIYYEEKEKKK